MKVPLAGCTCHSFAKTHLIQIFSQRGWQGFPRGFPTQTRFSAAVQIVHVSYNVACGTTTRDRGTMGFGSFAGASCIAFRRCYNWMLYRMHQQNYQTPGTMISCSCPTSQIIGNVSFSCCRYLDVGEPLGRSCHPLGLSGSCSNPVLNE